nr:ribonuclease H-like domain-containing protein [Tanacetum cinerariifolium]
MITRSQSGIVKPIDRLSLHTSSISTIHKNPSHALKDLNWCNAMYNEYNALVKIGTWLLVPRLVGVNMVRSMWLFKHKFHADGTLSRYKAHLVANGSGQQLGVDFDEKFSPFVKPAIFRTVLSLVVSRKWPIHQLDAKNALLNGGLYETVYMHQPPGFVDRLSSYLLTYLCGRHHSHSFLSSPTLADYRRSMIYSSLSVLTWLLVTFIGQPLIHSLNWVRKVFVQDPTLYRSLAGGLQYLTFTRPDLSYAVQQICLYMHDPREPHFAALKRILRYVRGIVFCLRLYVSATTSLVGYTDADWAGCPSTCRSTSGYCVFLEDYILSWSAKRQHTISRSSAEAEYQGVANVVAETAWIRNLLRELYSHLSTATLVYRVNYADIFTKGLPTALFEDCRSSLSALPLPAQTAGAY